MTRTRIAVAGTVAALAVTVLLLGVPRVAVEQHRTTLPLPPNQHDSFHDRGV